MNKNIKWFLIVLGFIVGIYFILHPYYINGLYWDCSKIEEGMTREQAALIMQKYSKNRDFVFVENENGISVGYAEFTCIIEIKNNRVSDVKDLSVSL